MNDLLVIDDSIFREDFAKRPFRIRHRLAGHPYFSLERIAAVLPKLPADRVEYNAGDVPVNATYGSIQHNGLTPEETIRRIEERRSWMVLKNVEKDEDFGGMLEECLDEVAERSESIEPAMGVREGYVFVSSPGSVTPYHIDPEHNFLLQIRGTKTIHLFDGGDRSVLSDEELERFYTGGGRNLVFREELQKRARTYVLKPGDGLYFPVTHPHWVKNGPEPSISFSITFRTPATAARDRLYKMNAALRSIGVPFVRPGAVPALDRAKLVAFEVGRVAKRFFANEPAFAG